MNDNYLTIDEMFTNLFNQATNIEAVWINKNKFDLTSNEVRIINKIGTMNLLSFGALAQSLKITPGTLTVAVNKLVKKQYLDKLKDEKDKRAVFLSLTHKGENVFKQHNKFRLSLIKNTLMKLEKHDSKTLVKILKDLTEIFANEEKNIKENNRGDNNEKRNM